MSTAVRDQIKEDLAQLGVKRGSFIWPVVATLLAIIVLAVYFDDEKSAMGKFFDVACKAGRIMPTPQIAADADVTPGQAVATQCFASQLPSGAAISPDAIAPDEAIAIKADFVRLDLLEKLNALHYLYNADGIKLILPSDGASGPGRETSQSPDAAGTPAVEKAAEPKTYSLTQNMWPLFVEASKIYTRELIAKFGTIISDFANTAWIVGLVSLIPGLAGMIYRRNFWGWYTPPFLVLFVATSGIIGQSNDEGRLLLFLVTQLLIILLALRLQRYTRKTGTLPSQVHNWILAALLTAVAVAWWFGIGGKLWTSWHGWYQYQFIFIGLPVLYSLLRRSDAWNATAPKNIVICLDGTTNTPDQFESGRLAQTNVFKLFKMPKSNANEVPSALTHAFNASLNKRYADKQIAFYYSGVGNKFEYDPIVQLLGGATGLGAAAVVDRAYLDIIRVYRPGDRIFIFGFSRGAAIARLLARAIDQRGAPKTIWTWRLLGRHWTVWQSRLALTQNVPVAVLGCFDTVGAFGIGKNIAGIEFQKLDLFKDLTVPDNVEQAYHMVALDETREEFSPTLMEPDPINPARLIEVWFSGDHANIGGGWGTTKLSDLTLDFLLRKISSGYAAEPSTMKPGDESWGMYLNAVNGKKATPEQLAGTRAFVLHPDPLGQLRIWRSAVYIYKPRKLPQHAVISETVFERMTNAAPLYAPPSLFNLHDELNQRRESINNAIARLKETNSVSASEHDAILKFKERLQLIRWPQYAETLKGLGSEPHVALSNSSTNSPRSTKSAPGPNQSLVNAPAA